MCAVAVDGTAWCWAAGESDPEQVAGVAGARDVAHEDALSCAQLTNGKVTCWGLATSDDGTDEDDPIVVRGLGT
jgi:hypothetical protein